MVSAGVDGFVLSGASGVLSRGVSLSLSKALSAAFSPCEPLSAPAEERVAGIPDMPSEIAAKLETVDCPVVATVA